MRWTRVLSEEVVGGQSQLAFVSGLPRVNGYRRPGFGRYRRTGSGTCLFDRQVWRGGRSWKLATATKSILVTMVPSVEVREFEAP